MTFYIADDELRAWLADKAKAADASENGIIIQALYTLRALDNQEQQLRARLAPLPFPPYLG